MKRERARRSRNTNDRVETAGFITLAFGVALLGSIASVRLGVALGLIVVAAALILTANAGE